MQLFLTNGFFTNTHQFSASQRKILIKKYENEKCIYLVKQKIERHIYASTFQPLTNYKEINKL
jgi:hypothetical protein